MSKTLFFLDYLSRREPRDYVILVDRGAASTGLRWLEATKALSALLPFVCAADTDGSTVYIVAQKVTKLGRLKNAAEVDKLLGATEAGGETCLAGPLDDAMRDHFANPKKPTSILVVTPGVVKDQLETAKVIVKASNHINNEYDLTISLVQVGDDPQGTAYLRELSQGLGKDCRFPIVDAASVDQMPANLAAYLQHSSQPRAFTTAPAPAPFKRPVLKEAYQPSAGGISPSSSHSGVNAAINAAIHGTPEKGKTPAPTYAPRTPEAQSTVNTGIRAASFAPEDQHAAVNAAISHLGKSPPLPAAPVLAPSVDHAAVNAALRRSSGSASPSAHAPASPAHHVAVNAAIQRASGGASPKAAAAPSPSSPSILASLNEAIRRNSGASSPAAQAAAHQAATPAGGRRPSAEHAAIDAAIKKAEQDMPLKVAFLDAIRLQQPRDFVVLLDCSKAMTPLRWNAARQTLAKLAPQICSLDSDGVNLYLFNETWKKVPNINAGPILDDIFLKHVPYGGICLAPVLNAAFVDYFSNGRKRGRLTSILVLVAGYATDTRQAADFIVQAAGTVNNDQELTVSFLQIGTEKPYVGDIALQCNSRSRNKIVDGHAVGFNATYSDGIPIDRFVDQYFRIWPAYRETEAFPIQAERVIIQHHMGHFVFE